MYQDTTNKYLCLRATCCKNILGYLDEQVSEIIRNIGDTWECIQCGKTAKTRQHIKYHAEKHLGIQMSCNYCGKLFTTSHSLSNHVSKYHK